MIYSISLSGLIVVFTVLFFVFFVGKQLILITNKFSTNLNNYLGNSPIIMLRRRMIMKDSITQDY